MEKVTAGKEQLGDFAPQFAAFNDDTLFGEVWMQEQVLGARDLTVITVIDFIAETNFEQLTFYLKKARDNGVTKEEMVEIITQLTIYSGWSKAWPAFAVAKKVLESSAL